MLKESDWLDGNFVIEDHRAKHIVKILKSDVGDVLKVGLLQGNMGKAKILDIKKKYPFYVTLQCSFDSPPPQKTPIDLIVALPRPIMLRRILSQATALGVKNIHLINANRVEKSFWEATLIKDEEYIDHLYTGLEQAVDTILPEIQFHKRFKVFIEDFLPTIANEYSTCLYAHPTSSNGLKSALEKGKKEDKILLAIGPEGGWVDFEDQKFKEAGFLGFTIGERILKVDSAVVNIHGRIMERLQG